jgi:hypothetical protein
VTRATPALKTARRCYGHLAGEAGIVLREMLEAAGYLRLQDGAYRLTDSGRRWAETLGLETDDRDPAKYARRCLDWTEKRPHIGGRLGRALLERLIETGAIVPGEGRELRGAVAGSGSGIDFRTVLAI